MTDEMTKAEKTKAIAEARLRAAAEAIRPYVATGDTAREIAEGLILRVDRAALDTAIDLYVPDLREELTADREAVRVSA